MHHYPKIHQKFPKFLYEPCCLLEDEVDSNYFLIVIVKYQTLFIDKLLILQKQYTAGQYFFAVNFIDHYRFVFTQMMDKQGTHCPTEEMHQRLWIKNAANALKIQALQDGRQMKNEG